MKIALYNMEREFEQGRGPSNIMHKNRVTSSFFLSKNTLSRVIGNVARCTGDRYVFTLSRIVLVGDGLETEIL